MRKLYHRNTKQEKAGWSILTSDRTNLKAREVIRDKGEHYVTMKGSVLQEDVAILNVCARLTTAYRKFKTLDEKLLKLMSHYKAKSNRNVRRKGWVDCH